MENNYLYKIIEREPGDELKVSELEVILKAGWQRFTKGDAANGSIILTSPEQRRILVYIFRKVV